MVGSRGFQAVPEEFWPRFQSIPEVFNQFGRIAGSSRRFLVVPQHL